MARPFTPEDRAHMRAYAEAQIRAGSRLCTKAQHAAYLRSSTRRPSLKCFRQAWWAVAAEIPEAPAAATAVRRSAPAVSAVPSPARRLSREEVDALYRTGSIRPPDPAIVPETVLDFTRRAAHA